MFSIYRMVMRRRRFSKTRPMRGYKSKTQVIAHNEARKVVKRQITKTIERKRFDAQSQTYVGIPTTGVIRSLFTDYGSGTPASIGEGTGPEQTVGGTIQPVYVYMNYVLSPGSVTANSVVRVIIFQLKGGGTPTLTDIVQTNINPTLSNYDLGSFGTVGHRGDYKILYDKLTFVSTDERPIITYRVRIPRRRLIQCRFDPVAGAANVFHSGNIYVLFVGDNGTNAPEVKYFSSIEYIDA